MLWIHLEGRSFWNVAHYPNNANRPGWARAEGPNLLYKGDALEKMGSLLRGKQVAPVGWVGVLLSWGGEQQQRKCWDWQEKLVEVFSYVAGHSCSTALSCAWGLRVAELAAGGRELQSQAGKVAHSELHFSSICLCKIVRVDAIRTPAFQKCGMKLNNAGMSLDEWRVHKSLLQGHSSLSLLPKHSACHVFLVVALKGD